MSERRAEMPTAHYPDGSLPDEAALLATLAETVETLEGAGVDHLLMGGVGSFALARPRETHDIDVFIAPGSLDTTLDLLGQAGFDVGVHDPMWLAKAFKRDVLVDIVFRSAGDVYLDPEMLERSERRDYKGVSARVIAAEDLAVIKALATSEPTAHHWYDALAILSRCPIDWEYLLRRATQAGPRRVLSLLLYAESIDILVPASAVSELHELIYS